MRHIKLMNELNLKSGRALAIVAHPDDETIWMGGTILKFKNVDWTIMSLCRADDPDRAPKFRRVSDFYGTRAIISDLEDEGIMDVEASVPEIEERIVREIHSEGFTYLFTHGYNGEYGHPRHQGVHRAAVKLFREGKLSAEQFFVFSYECPEGETIPVPAKDAAYQSEFSEKIYAQKKDLIEKFYGFSKESFEYRSCAPRENFDELSK